MINAELERLAVLAEECSEVVQIVGKIIRHGYDSHHPADMSGPDNRAMLEQELGDVKAILRLMLNAGDVDIKAIKAARFEKYTWLQVYFHNAKNIKLATDEAGMADAIENP